MSSNQINPDDLLPLVRNIAKYGARLEKANCERNIQKDSSFSPSSKKASPKVKTESTKFSTPNQLKIRKKAASEKKRITPKKKRVPRKQEDNTSPNSSNVGVQTIQSHLSPNSTPNAKVGRSVNSDQKEISDAVRNYLTRGIECQTSPRPRVSPLYKKSNSPKYIQLSNQGNNDITDSSELSSGQTTPQRKRKFKHHSARKNLKSNDFQISEEVLIVERFSNEDNISQESQNQKQSPFSSSLKRKIAPPPQIIIPNQDQDHNDNKYSFFKAPETSPNVNFSFRTPEKQKKSDANSIKNMTPPLTPQSQFSKEDNQLPPLKKSEDRFKQFLHDLSEDSFDETLNENIKRETELMKQEDEQEKKNQEEFDELINNLEQTTQNEIENAAIEVDDELNEILAENEEEEQATHPVDLLSISSEEEEDQLNNLFKENKNENEQPQKEPDMGQIEGDLDESIESLNDTKNEEGEVNAEIESIHSETNENSDDDQILNKQEFVNNSESEKLNTEEDENENQKEEIVEEESDNEDLNEIENNFINEEDEKEVDLNEDQLQDDFINEEEEINQNDFINEEEEISQNDFINEEEEINQNDFINEEEEINQNDFINEEEASDDAEIENLLKELSNEEDENSDEQAMNDLLNVEEEEETKDEFVLPPQTDLDAGVKNNLIMLVKLIFPSDEIDTKADKIKDIIKSNINCLLDIFRTILKEIIIIAQKKDHDRISTYGHAMSLIVPQKSNYRQYFEQIAFELIPLANPLEAYTIDDDEDNYDSFKGEALSAAIMFSYWARISDYNNLYKWIEVHTVNNENGNDSFVNFFAVIWFFRFVSYLLYCHNVTEFERIKSLIKNYSNNFKSDLEEIADNVSTLQSKVETFENKYESFINNEKDESDENNDNEDFKEKYNFCRLIIEKVDSQIDENEQNEAEKVDLQNDENEQNEAEKADSQIDENEQNETENANLQNEQKDDETMENLQNDENEHKEDENLVDSNEEENKNDSTHPEKEESKEADNEIENLLEEEQQSESSQNIIENQEKEEVLSIDENDIIQDDEGENEEDNQNDDDIIIDDDENNDHENSDKKDEEASNKSNDGVLEIEVDANEDGDIDFEINNQV